MSKTRKVMTDAAFKSIKKGKDKSAVRGATTKSEILDQPVDGAESSLHDKTLVVRPSIARGKVLRIGAESFLHDKTIVAQKSPKTQRRRSFFKSRRSLLKEAGRQSGMASRPSFPGSGVIVVSASIPAQIEPQPPANLEQLASEVLGNPSSWFSTPNPNLGSRKPAELIGTKEEYKVFDLLYAVDQGFF